MSPWSIALMISLWIRTNAVSVEKLALYADWVGESNDWESMWAESLLLTSRSRVFDMKDRLDIGRYDERSSGSREDFFNNGWTIAFLCAVGNLFCWKEELNMEVMTGDKTGLSRLRSHVGMGSDGHCLLADCFNSWLTSDVVTGWNASNLFETGRVVIAGRGALDVDWRIVWIFLEKKSAKSSAEWSLFDPSTGGISRRHRNLDHNHQLTVSGSRIHYAFPIWIEFGLVQNALLGKLGAPSCFRQVVRMSSVLLLQLPCLNFHQVTFTVEPRRHWARVLRYNDWRSMFLQETSECVVVTIEKIVDIVVRWVVDEISR